MACGNLGSGRGAPAGIGFTISGVTITISSVLCPGPLNRLEEPAENWNIAEKRDLQESFGFAIIQQPADGKALAILKLDFRLHPAHRNGGHGESGDGDGIREVQGADFRSNLETDGSARRDGGDEVQPDAIVLELDCDDCSSACSCALSHWIGVFTACKKAGLFAILGKHVGLGECFNQTSCFKSFDGRSKVNPGIEGKELQRIRDRNRVWLVVPLGRVRVGGVESACRNRPNRVCLRRC